MHRESRRQHDIEASSGKKRGRFAGADAAVAWDGVWYECVVVRDWFLAIRDSSFVIRDP